MWRPPGEERRQQRRSGAGRHITVLATQPEQVGGSAVRALVGRTGARKMTPIPQFTVVSSLG